MIRNLFTSKKFVVMVAAVVMAIASRLGLNLDPTLVNQLLAIAGAYIVGQGIADNGKEAAQIAANTKTTVVEHDVTGVVRRTVTTSVPTTPVVAPSVVVAPVVAVPVVDEPKEPSI